MSTKISINVRLVFFLICCVAIFQAMRFNGWISSTATTATVTSAIKHIQTYDFGNAIAALLAIGGYLLENWISRKSSQLQKQMERVEAQSHQLLVPVTMQFHSLWLGSIKSFVDKHIDEVLSKEENKETSTEYLNFSGRYEIPTSLKNPASFAMILENMRSFKGDGTSEKSWKVTSKYELPLILHKEIQNCF